MRNEMDFTRDLKHEDVHIARYMSHVDGLYHHISADTKGVECEKSERMNWPSHHGSQNGMQSAGDDMSRASGDAKTRRAVVDEIKDLKQKVMSILLCRS